MKHFRKINLTSSPLFLFIWIIICALISISLIKSLWKVFASQQRIHTLEQQKLTLEVENATLRQNITEANSPFMQEKMIRDELGMQLPNEKVIQIINAPSSSPSPQFNENQKTTIEKPSFIRRILQLFFKK